MAKQGFIKMSNHVRKYLFLYTTFSLIIGTVVGCLGSDFIDHHPLTFSYVIVAFAIATIFPSMIQLRTEKLIRSFTHIKGISTSIAFIFIIAPLLAFLAAPIFKNSELSLGFLVSNIVPASSASLGYVLIAEGNIELATAIAIISLVGAVPMVPLYTNIYAQIASVSVPIDKVMLSIIYTLVTPFILGQITRYAIKRKRGEKYVNSMLKPYLSLATMLTMLMLIALLIMRKAPLIIKKPSIALEIISLQSIIIIGVFLMAAVVSRSIHIRYTDHIAIAFISVTKNQSVAAAIAVLALGATAALPPAIIPAIQAPLCIIFIHMDKILQKFLGK